MEEPAATPESESGWSWTRNLRTSHAVALEAVRLTIAAVLVVNLVFAVFEVWASPASGFYFVPHDPKYAGIAAHNVEVFALDKPLGTRYIVFLFDVFTGNLGLSFYYAKPVTDVVLGTLPITFELLLGSLLWALLFGGLLGWASASRRFRLLGTLARESGSVLYAIPVFVLALLLVEWCAVAFRLSLGIPDIPFAPPRVTGFYTIDALLSGDLGRFETALTTTALLTLPAGLAFSLPVLHRVRIAIEERRASPALAGLPADRSLPLRHAVVSSLVPLLGSVGILIPFLYSASAFAEVLTGRRGVGWLLFSAFGNLDGPVLLAATLVPALIVILVSAPFTVLAAALLRRAPASSPTAQESEARSVRYSFPRNLLDARAATIWIGLVLILIPTGLSLAAPLLTPYGPLQRVVPVGQACTTGLTCPLSPPSPGHPLGIDFYGMDIFSEVLWGGQGVFATVATAICISAGLGLALGMFVPALGRGLEQPVRALLGGLAAVPLLSLVALLLFVEPVALVLGIIFLPIFFRDARDPAVPAAQRAGPSGRRLVALAGWSDRVHSGAQATIPRFLSILPRRAAEMVLVAEGISFLLAVPFGVPDWAGVIRSAMSANFYLIGNPWWVYVPSLLLILLTAGLLLLSDGLRTMLSSVPPPSTAGALVLVLPPPTSNPPEPNP